VQSSEDLVELYCGGGTFTAPLSRNFRSVLATELSKASVVLAKKAFADNGITNVTVAPVSAEDFSGAYNKYLLSKRARPDGTSRAIFTGGNLGHSGSVQGITNLADFDNISTVFVDPPRAGCDDATCKLLARFDKICYISCNPETLARDIAKITAIVGPGTSSATNANSRSDGSSTSGSEALYRHRIVRMAAFDQFPYTPHLEGGVMLVKERIPDAEAQGLGIAAKVADVETAVGEKRKAA
jgi:tRNA (uracil-5-)-methyltransferase